MENLKIKNQTFEEIKHIDKNGVEFWYARELQIKRKDLGRVQIFPFFFI